MQKKFKSEIESSHGAWCFLPIPFSVAETWGAKGRLFVKGIINGVEFRGTISPMGGRHLLMFNKQLQAATRAGAGDVVSVVMEPDTEERTVEVPKELTKGFRGNKDAKGKWDKLAYSHRRQFALWINDAKQEATRQRRADKAITMLLAGKTVN